VPVAWWLGVLSLIQLLVVALLAGVAAVFYRTAYAKLLPAVVPDEALEPANARLFGTESVAQIAGPGLAALIVQVMAAALGVLLDVIGFCVSAHCLVRIRSPRAVDRSAAIGRSGSLRQQISEGVRTVLADPPLRLFMIIGGLSNFGLTGVAALQLVFLVDGLGLSPGELGALLMIGNVGGLLGALIAPAVARRIGTGRASTVLLVIGGPAALLIGAPSGAGQVALAAIGLFVLGAAVVAGNVIRGAWRQRYVPPRLMGRVLTTIQAVNFGTMPVAGLAAGVLGARLGVQPAILLMAGVHCAACLAVLSSRLGRARSLPAPVRAPVDDSVAV
jgi:predicted MFS family arabinose efflux permease